jgi:hypothetical protein
MTATFSFALFCCPKIERRLDKYTKTSKRTMNQIHREVFYAKTKQAKNGEN